MPSLRSAWDEANGGLLAMSRLAFTGSEWITRYSEVGMFGVKLTCNARSLDVLRLRGGGLCDCAHRIAADNV